MRCLLCRTKCLMKAKSSMHCRPLIPLAQIYAQNKSVALHHTLSLDINGYNQHSQCENQPIALSVVSLPRRTTRHRDHSYHTKPPLPPPPPPPPTPSHRTIATAHPRPPPPPQTPQPPPHHHPSSQAASALRGLTQTLACFTWLLASLYRCHSLFSSCTHTPAGLPVV